MATLTLQEFDFGKMASNSTCAIIGKRRSGKTTWLRFIATKIARIMEIDRFLAVAGNKDNACEWKEIFPCLFVHEKETAIETLKAIRDYQDKKVSKYRQRHEAIPRKYRLLLVIDDMASSMKFMKHELVKDIFSNGRHYGLTILMSLQYLHQLETTNRSQLDYVLLLHNRNEKTLKKIHEEYVHGDFRTFKHVMAAATENRGCLFIDNVSSNSEVNNICKYKYIDHDFRVSPIASHALQNYSDLHTFEQQDEDDTNSNSSFISNYESEESGPNFRTAFSEICSFNDRHGKLTIRKQALGKEKID